MSATQDLPLVVAITGASGVIYGKTLVEVLLRAGREVHLTISPSASLVFQEELGVVLDLNNLRTEQWLEAPGDRLRYWNHLDFRAGIASGSFRTAGMAIVPCSMSTLGAIANGTGTNLIHRAAEVHLKERRKLILTPRETPLHLIGLENMAAVTRAGAIVLPAMPGFYHRPASIADLVAFVVARICDQLEVPMSGAQRWGEAIDIDS